MVSTRNVSHFSGTDWDDVGKRNGIYRFEGKNWNRKTSGLAVLIMDSVAGTKRMKVHEKFAGCKFYDVLGHFIEPVVLDSEGSGDFKVDGVSVSVWVPEVVYQKLYTELA